MKLKNIEHGSDDSEDEFYGFDLSVGSGEKFGSVNKNAKSVVETFPAVAPAGNKARSTYISSH